MSAHRPLPVIDDPDTGGFYRAAAEGRLALRWCGSCQRPVHLPRAICDGCYGPTDWLDVPGTGSVVTSTVVVRQVHPAFPTPYTLILVEIDGHPGVRLVGSLPGAVDTPAGTAVDVVFEETAPGTVMPNWQVRSPLAGREAPPR